MTDQGAKYTDKELEKTEKKIQQIYSEAQKDIEDKLAKWSKKFVAKSNALWQQVQDGTLDYDDYSHWVDGQLFQSEQWESKKDQIIGIVQNANKEATKIINGGTISVFAENANWSHYEMEHDKGINFGFGIYDANAVTNLIKNDPQVLPKWKVNEKKDYKWNSKKVNNSITQGIIQGEKLDEIAKRLAKGLASNNKNTMLTFARTAMTGAQNAGRNQGLMDAKDIGIEVVKEWVATLDHHTRTSHRHLDGEKQKVGDKWHPFKFSNGCRYPGDPQGPPHEVYNCRCTLVGDIEKYPDKFKRYDNIDGVPVKGMTYKEWLKSKGGSLKPGSPKLETAKKKLVDLQKQVQDVGADKVFSDIWYNQDVTYADWEAKKDSIQAKKDYYTKKIAELEGATTPLKKAALDHVKEKLKELEEFEKHGEEYSKLLKDLEEAKKAVKNLTPRPVGPFGPDAYTQERKDNALWAKSPKQADKNLRGVCGEVWRNASAAERDAIYEYTQSYHKFNEPLRGYEYGTSRYLGVGNTDLNAGYANNGKRLNAMTSIIDKSSYEEDIWLQRGCNYGGMDKFFQCSMDLLQNGSQKELEDELLGKVVTEWGFMSCGSSKGQGFSGKPIILNVYTPAGTKMMYAEPFSAFGDGDGESWNGTNTQSSFGGELETILQQCTQFRVSKIEKSDRLYFDIEVFNQLDPQLWKQ